MRLRHSGLMACIFVLLFSFSAHALVTEWDYTISAVFTDSTFVVGGGDTDGVLNGDYVVTDTKLSWGVPSGSEQSSLEISKNDVSPTSGSYLQTYIGNGAPASSYWGDSIELKHNNYGILHSSDRLYSTTLSTTVVLDPHDPDDPAFAGQTFTFDLQFVETPNGGNHPSDIFALIGGFPNFTFNYQDSISAAEISYYVNVFPSDGTVLSYLTPEEMELVGVAEPTLGFTTTEGQSTTLPFAFTISTTPLTTNTVPEPTTLILLGGGLAGLAFYRRKRK